jgi:hypothetical protein
MFEIKWHGSGFRMLEWTLPIQTTPFLKEAERRIRSYKPYESRTLTARRVAELGL